MISGRPLQAEGCGGAMGPRSGPGSKGSKGSKGSEGVVSPDGDEYEDSVTGFTFVTPVIHADGP